MAKYSYEFKKKIIQEYPAENGGATYFANKYNIPHDSAVEQWIKNYLAYGDKGLRRSRQNNNFFEYKLYMVELYLSSEVSFRKLAAKEGINNPAILVRWVNDFRIAGSDALRSKKNGRKRALDSKKQTKTVIQTINKTSINTSAEHVKQLEDELLKLRIENAYLKELRRLRLAVTPRISDVKRVFLCENRSLGIGLCVGH